MLYPKFEELIALKDRKLNIKRSFSSAVKSTAPGNHSSPFRGQGLEFDSVREYVPGDDIRRIDWRVTARTGAPHLKVFKEDRERQVTICIDVNATMRFGTKNTFKSIIAARVASLLGWHGIAQHDKISVYLFGDVPQGVQFFAPHRTKNAFSQVLKVLSQPPHEQHIISLEDILKKIQQTAHSGSLIYLISDFMHLSNDLENNLYLNQLSKRCDLICITVNDQADKILQPIGLLGFHSLQGKKAYFNTENKTGREKYILQWQENRAQLATISSKLKIPKIELSTESDVYFELIHGLKMIAKRKK